MLGGGMRQVGIIAAAGIVALQKMVNRLVEDHANARRFAHGLAKINGIGINPEKVHTNIIVFETPPTLYGAEFIQRMDAKNVKFTSRGEHRIRAVTHRMISDTHIDEALERIGLLINELD